MKWTSEHERDLRTIGYGAPPSSIYYSAHLALLEIQRLRWGLERVARMARRKEAREVFHG